MSGRSSAPNADARSVSAITSPAQVELTDALALPALAAYDAASHANAPCEIAFDAASLRLLSSQVPARRRSSQPPRRPSLPGRAWHAVRFWQVRAAAPLSAGTPLGRAHSDTLRMRRAPRNRAAVGSGRNGPGS
jgi:hypothetical protein